MHPYRNRLQWNLRAPAEHLIDGLEPVVDQLPSDIKRRFLAASRDVRRTLKIRLGVLILLYIGIISSAITWITQLIPTFQVFLDLLRPLAQILSGISVLFLLVTLLLQRRIGQLEADLVAICIVHLE